MLPGNRVKVSTATVGIGTSIVLGQPASNLYLTPTQAGFVDQGTYHYVIEQGDDWEHNSGVWDLNGNTITRGTPIISKITGTVSTNKLNLNGTGYVYFPFFRQIIPFDIGTSMVFHQAAAPVGWTKSTAHDNKAMRIVSGTTGGGAGGGVQSFTNVFNRTATDDRFVMPEHRHGVFSATKYYIVGAGSYAGVLAGSDVGIYYGDSYINTTDSPNAGSTSPTHNHTIDLRVQYCDVIIGVKS